MKNIHFSFQDIMWLYVYLTYYKDNGHPPKASQMLSIIRPVSTQLLNRFIEEVIGDRSMLIRSNSYHPLAKRKWTKAGILDDKGIPTASASELFSDNALSSNWEKWRSVQVEYNRNDDTIIIYKESIT